MSCQKNKQTTKKKKQNKTKKRQVDNEFFETKTGKYHPMVIFLILRRVEKIDDPTVIFIHAWCVCVFISFHHRGFS